MGQYALLSGSEDTRVRVWDVRSGKCVITFKEHTGKINSVQLSPDTKWAATGGDDGSLKIWDIGSGKTLSNFNFPG
jgi:transcription initiation factor TFIID subunit 5